jgi:hypothetical protein
MNRSTKLLVVLAMIASLGIVVLPAMSTTWDFAGDFSNAANPNSPWTYGWWQAAGGGYTPWDTSIDNSGLSQWNTQYSPHWGYIGKNTTSSAWDDGNIYVEAGATAIWTDPYGDATDLRWTSTVQAMVTLTGRFYGESYAALAPVEVQIYHNIQGPLWDQMVSGFVGRQANAYSDATGTAPVQSFTLSVAVNPGDVVDFVVRNSPTVVGLDATFTAPGGDVPEPGSMLALGSGLVGLVGFAIRRRK